MSKGASDLLMMTHAEPSGLVSTRSVSRALPNDSHGPSTDWAWSVRTDSHGKSLLSSHSSEQGDSLNVTATVELGEELSLRTLGSQVCEQQPRRHS